MPLFHTLVLRECQKKDQTHPIYHSKHNVVVLFVHSGDCTDVCIGPCAVFALALVEFTPSRGVLCILKRAKNLRRC